MGSILDDLFGHNEEVKQFQNPMVIDLSNILHATYHGMVRFDSTLNSDLEKYAMWRYFLLNSIITIKTKFQPDELVLAIDSSSWRKKEFKYYKAQRVLAREKQTDFNYKEFIEISNGFIAEIEEFLPYKVVRVDGAEADDIIAVLVNLWRDKNITIVSRDKDFKQLLRSPNIKMYDPIDKEFKTVECPYAYLMEHILIGDKSDGIPNMLSDDNIFVTSGKRQKSITKNVKASMSELGLEKFAIENNIIDKYERNKKLVELSKDEIPEDIWNNIIFRYNELDPKGDYIKVLQFLQRHKIRALVDKVDRFLF